jgi:hypothetical protein
MSLPKIGLAITAGSSCFGIIIDAPLTYQCRDISKSSPKLSDAEIKEIQRIIGSILCHVRAVDITVLMALSSIAREHTRGTTNTMAKAKQLLDYLVMHPDATMRF